MQTGTYISGIGHLAVIGWTILGGVMFRPEEAPEFQVTDVTIVSEAAFAAQLSEAPLPTTRLEAPQQPEPAADSPTPPAPEEQPRRSALPDAADSQDPGVRPDLSALTEAARAEAQIEAPALPQPAQTETPGARVILPDARRADRESAGIRSPDRLALLPPAQRPSPRIDSTPAPAPPTDAERAQEAERATAPDPEATEPGEERTEKAPDQASTEIITEAKEAPTESAPVRTSRPRGRPARLGDADSAASEIERAIARAQAGSAAPPPAPAAPAAGGPPLTGAEKDRLRLAVRRCWNVNPTSESARITVTVAVRMEPDGMPVLSSIRQLSATEGSARAQRSAFDAARRAIIRCARGGYPLPPEKYDRWREIEMTFNPDKMRIR